MGHLSIKFFSSKFCLIPSLFAIWLGIKTSLLNSSHFEGFSFKLYCLNLANTSSSCMRCSSKHLDITVTSSRYIDKVFHCSPDNTKGNTLEKGVGCTNPHGDPQMCVQAIFCLKKGIVTHLPQSVYNIMVIFFSFTHI